MMMKPLTGRRSAGIKFVAAIFATLTLTSCSRYLDALVCNPCAQPARVSFGGMNGAHWDSETGVPAESAVRVANVMSTSPGKFDQVRVVFDEASPAILKSAYWRGRPGSGSHPCRDVPRELKWQRTPGQSIARPTLAV